MTDEEEQRYNELLQRAVMAEDLVETMARQAEAMFRRMVRDLRQITVIAFFSGLVMGASIMHWWLV